MSRRRWHRMAQRALLAMAALLPLLYASNAAAQSRSRSLVHWPVRWTSLAQTPAVAPQAEASTAITITAPSSLGVTVTGAVVAAPIDVGFAVDAPGLPMDLARFGAMQRSRTMLGVIGQRPRGMPLSGGFLTSGFGPRVHPILGGLRKHSGIDLAAPIGTPVVAPGGGTVRNAGWNGGYGLSVEIDHGGGVRSRYGHMSRLNVYPGQQLRGGEVIGFVGSTGRSTGPHLHYEIIDRGRAVNPLDRH